MYVSNVIDDLTSELEDRTSRVTEHLAWAIHKADQFRRLELSKTFSPEDVGVRPLPLTPDNSPVLWPRAINYLPPLRRLVWPVLSQQRRDTVLAKNAAFQKAAHNYDVLYRKAVLAREQDIQAFDEKVELLASETAAFNQEVEELLARSSNNDLEAQWILFEMRFHPFIRQLDPLSGQYRMTYSADSHRVVVEIDVPAKSIVPLEKSVRFLKTTGEHRYSYRTDADIKRLYASFVSQAVLGVLRGAFRLSSDSLVQTVGVTALVEAPDPATGVVTPVPIVSVVSSRGEVDAIQFDQVDPVACLRHLSAVVSRSPAEVVPIRPIVRLDMSDPRFVGDSDILAELDGRPNLMELTPNQFEGLVQNLFSKMGLDTKQTRPSRDGGVDAIAYDPRPILGGKIVIQAKRYKGTVGVSAVRDLYGTLQNEGGSKGILVTTSGYGPASFEFAKNKPLELIDGSNLLYLLKEHAGVEAKIVMPDDWVDPSPDGQ